MPPLRNIRHETFAQLLFEHASDPDWPDYRCYQEAYKCSIKSAMKNATKLRNTREIEGRLAEFEAEVATARIMTVREIEERLSEIARARMSDFVECGRDGSYVTVGPESAKSAAIQEITTRTTYDTMGNDLVPTMITKLKLHNPMPAMDMLLKRKGAYPPVKHSLDDKAQEVADAIADRILRLCQQQ